MRDVLNRLFSWRIRTKLIVFCLLFIVILLVLYAYLVNSHRNVELQTVQLSEISDSMLDELTQLNHHHFLKLNYFFGAKDLSLYKERIKKLISRTTFSYQRLQEIGTKIEKISGIPEKQIDKLYGNLVVLQEKTKQSDEIILNFLKLSDAKKTESKNELFINKIRQQELDYYNLLQHLNVSIKEIVANIRTKFVDSQAQLSNNIFYITMVSILFSIIFSVFIVRDIGGALMGIVDHLREDITHGKRIKISHYHRNDEIGEVVLAYNALTDELDRAQKELRLSEKLSAIGKLTGFVGHELRNPLNVIRLAARGLIRRVKENNHEKVNRYIEVINEEVTKADKIIEDILTFSRIKKPTLFCCNLKELLDNLISETNIPENIKIIQDITDELSEIMIDAVQIQQVFRNLFANAD